MTFTSRLCWGASMVAVSSANTSIRYYGNNGEASENILFNQGDVKWTLNVKSFLDMDLGEEFVELEHILEAPIFATDEVAFYVSF